MSSKNNNINSGQFRIVSSFNIGGGGAYHIYDNHVGSSSVNKSTHDSYNKKYKSQGGYTKSSYLKYTKR